MQNVVHGCLLGAYVYAQNYIMFEYALHFI